MPAPQRGRIVWARMRDSRGGNEKLRPGVIVSDDEDIEADRPFYVVAISTSFSEPLSNQEVLLPWSPAGTARTKLRKKAVAVCDWLVELSAADVEEYGGIVPATVMNRILDLVLRLPE